MADHDVVGKLGRVTGTIAPGKLGEVMIPVSGGAEYFQAYGGDEGETIRTGSRIVVIEYLPPRTVVATRM